MEELLDRLERGWTLEENRFGWFIRGTKECHMDDVTFLVSREMVMELASRGILDIRNDEGRTVGRMVMR